MTFQLPKSFKWCLTCAYWCGPRRLIMAEKYVETESHSTKGECVKPKAFYHIKMDARNSCSQHESMPALRD